MHICQAVGIRDESKCVAIVIFFSGLSLTFRCMRLDRGRRLVERDISLFLDDDVLLKAHFIGDSQGIWPECVFVGKALRSNQAGALYTEWGWVYFIGRPGKSKWKSG